MKNKIYLLFFIIILLPSVLAYNITLDKVYTVNNAELSSYSIFLTKNITSNKVIVNDTNSYEYSTTTDYYNIKTFSTGELMLIDKINWAEWNGLGGAYYVNIKFQFNYNDSTKVNTSEFRTVGSTHNYSDVYNPSPGKAVNSVLVWLQCSATGASDCYIDDMLIYGYNSLVPSVIYNTSQKSFSIPTSGNYSFILSGTYNNFNSTPVNFANTSNITSNATNLYNGMLKLLGKNSSGSSITTYNVTIDGISYTSSSYVGSLGVLEIPGVNGLSYIATAGYTPTYANTDYNLTINSYLSYYNLTLYPFNSIFVTVRSETTGALVTGNTTLTLLGNTSSTATITTGSYLFSNLTNGVYTLSVANSGYQSKIYDITVNYGSTQNLTAYLLNTTYASSYVVFTFLDKNTNAGLSNVSVIVARYVNNSLVNIDSLTSDITGRLQVNFQPLTKYQFVVSKTGYETQLFYLNPIIFTSYTIKLQPDLTSVPGRDLNDVNIVYGPSLFYVDVMNDFTFSISSGEGSLQSYALNISYPGGLEQFTGTNAIGETFTSSFNITNATYNEFDTVNISYCYESTLGTDPHCYSRLYEIIGVIPSGSWLDNAGNTYGLGLLERLLIVTCIVLTIAGLFTIFISPIAGGVLGLFLFGLFSALGFIPLWGILPSLLVGFFVLSRRSTQ